MFPALELKSMLALRTVSGWCTQLAGSIAAIPHGAELICPRAGSSCCSVSGHGAVWRAGGGGFRAVQLTESSGTGSAYCLPHVHFLCWGPFLCWVGSAVCTVLLSAGDK